MGGKHLGTCVCGNRLRKRTDATCYVCRRFQELELQPIRQHYLDKKDRVVTVEKMGAQAVTVRLANGVVQAWRKARTGWQLVVPEQGARS